ncbi:ficolin-2-like [Drosophila busckii]|uniref:ficolin-2-like n=1 Tax=Drosophila busckii TaxID=30019 RepID=UPI0014328FD3|nr:ficolin-2-like [Drosophila busckii]
MRAVQVFLAILFVAVAAADVQPIEPFKSYPNSCKAAKAKKDGIRKLQLNSGAPFQVFCDAKTPGAGWGWLVIQRRVDNRENFFRSWSNYQQGFGDLAGNYFIGLDLLNELTSDQPQELWVELLDYSGQTRYAHYDNFAVGNESNLYTLNKLGLYTGNAGDALRYQENMKFSTFDRDNDMSPKKNCASELSGAWWYNDCMTSNLNGLYLGGEYGNDLTGRGMVWKEWLGDNYSYKTVKMMIRPKA